jgi:hypothetical protein
MWQGDRISAAPGEELTDQKLCLGLYCYNGGTWRYQGMTEIMALFVACTLIEFEEYMLVQDDEHFYPFYIVSCRVRNLVIFLLWYKLPFVTAGGRGPGIFWN